MRADVWLITRKRKKGVAYAIRWVDPMTKRVRCETAGRDKQLAKRLVEKKRADIRAGKLGETVRASFDEFVTMVVQKMREKERSPATVRETERVLRLFEMICAPKDVAAITTAMIDQFDAGRARGLRSCSQRSCNWSNVRDARSCWRCGAALTNRPRALSVEARRKDLRTLKAAFERARKAYRLPRNPFEDFEWPKGNVPLPRALEVAEILKLLEVADDQWQLFTYLAVVTGMRRGELLGLHWDDIDLNKGVCTVRHTKANKDRLAYLDSHAIAMLTKLRAGRRLVGRVSAPVFVRTDGLNPGRAWDAHYVKHQWPRIRESAGVAKCTVHDLRKTCGTFLAECGVNQRLAREVTGHSTSAILEKYYQLARVDAARDAVSKAAAPLRAAMGVS